jgi:hypothetical protein
VAYYSCQLLPAEIIYDVGDKELLAIVEGFKHYRHYAISTPASSPVKVLSDHKKLERFTTLSKLSRRQFRWAEMLANTSVSPSVLVASVAMPVPLVDALTMS